MIASGNPSPLLCILPKKPVSLRMQATVHAAAKRRAKELGMSSLAYYIEALVGHDTTEGFDHVVTYSASHKPRYRAVTSAGLNAKKKGARLLRKRGASDRRRPS